MMAPRKGRIDPARDLLDLLGQHAKDSSKQVLPQMDTGTIMIVGDPEDGVVVQLDNMSVPASDCQVLGAYLPAVGDRVGVLVHMEEFWILGGIAGQSAGTTPAGPPSGPAGGDLAGSYPNPTIKSSVALTGAPTAPTAAASTNTTQIATTAFVEGEIATKAPINNPTFTGDPRAPTPTPGDNDTSIATTAFVTAAIGAGAPPSGTAGGDLAGTYPNPTIKANVGLTGAPTAPTASPGTSTTQIASTAFVAAAAALKADLASPTFTGDPQAPTATPGDNDTSIATTAFVTAAVAAAIASISASPPELTGTIKLWGTTTAPSGYVLCDGSAISRTGASAALFALWGTTFGVGDGSTTFNVPNFKGAVPTGLDTGQTEFNTMGKTGGAKTHTHALTAATVASHAHALATGTSGSTGGAASHTHTNGGAVASHNHTLSDVGWAQIWIQAGASAPTAFMRRISANSYTANVQGDTTTGASSSQAGTLGAALDGTTDAAAPGLTGSTGAPNTTALTGTSGTAAPGLSGNTDASSTLAPYLTVNFIVKL